jgi:hypothetical protein
VCWPQKAYGTRRPPTGTDSPSGGKTSQAAPRGHPPQHPSTRRQDARQATTSTPPDNHPIQETTTPEPQHNSRHRTPLRRVPVFGPLLPRSSSHAARCATRFSGGLRCSRPLLSRLSPFCGSTTPFPPPSTAPISGGLRTIRGAVVRHYGTALIRLSNPPGQSPSR